MILIKCILNEHPDIIFLILFLTWSKSIMITGSYVYMLDAKYTTILMKKYFIPYINDLKYYNAFWKTSRRVKHFWKKMKPWKCTELCWRSFRPQNINWQDRKYISFLVFIRHSQNIRRHNTMGEFKLYGGRRRKHSLWILFRSFILHKYFLAWNKWFKIDFEITMFSTMSTTSYCTHCVVTPVNMYLDLTCTTYLVSFRRRLL